MRICAITMVYRDHWALSQWHHNYARHLGAENLFIVAHGPDPEIARRCPGSSILTVPRDRLDGFDAFRGRLLNGVQAGLGAVYDWVIRTDADELICLDPQVHDSFASLFAAQTGDALFALGLNMAERPGDAPLDPHAPALPARSSAVFSGHFSKAWAERKPLGFVRHGVVLGPPRVKEAAFHLPRGVYLAHLKFANQAALELSNQHRRAVAGGGTGRPGTAWQKPALSARKFYDRFESLPEQPWEAAEAEARAAILADPVRDSGKGVLRARNIRFSSRTTLPARIAKF